MPFSRIIPSKKEIEEFHNPLTEGEKYLIDFFDDNLKKDNTFDENLNKIENYNGWLIFVQPFLNNARPDIILYNPNVGIQIVEVKDWDLRHYSFEKIDNRNKLFVHNKEGQFEIKSPTEQATYYKKKITDILVPQIGESIDEDKKNFGLIKTSVYFHNAKTEHCKEFFKNIIPNFDVFPVFGRDSLNKSEISKIIPFSKYSLSKFWKKEWNQYLLFWFNPPYHSLEQGTQLKLSNDQLKFSEPSLGHHRIRGVAGCGKTQVLAYRAAKLASENKRVLILSFNLTLIHYINDMLKRTPFSFDFRNITTNYYHGFCGDLLNDFGVVVRFLENDCSKEKREEFFKQVFTDEVLKVISKKYYEKYDAILIDEGQDYYYEWYDMLSRFLNEQDELVIMCDKKQNIYDRNYDWLDKRVIRKGLEKFGNWNDMRIVYRLPEIIANAANKFSETFELNQEVKEIKNDNNQLSLFENRKPHFIWKNMPKTIDENRIWFRKKVLPEIWSQFCFLQKEGFHPSDTTIIFQYHKSGIECRDLFKSKGIESNDVFGYDNLEQKYHKSSFYQGDSRLKMCTIHSFKGWETVNVILYIDDWEPDDWTEDVINSLVYTSITRAKLNIIVLNSNPRYFEFGKQFSNNWENFSGSEIKEKYDMHIIIDSIFLNNAIKRTLDLYKQIYPDRIFQPISFGNIIRHISEFFSLKGKIKIIILESKDKKLIIDIDKEKIQSPNITIEIVKKECEFMIFGIDDCIEEGENINNILLIADDIGYIPVITKLLKTGINLNLLRNSNDNTNMISNELVNVNWQDIDYIIGLALGLKIYEL